MKKLISLLFALMLLATVVIHPQAMPIESRWMGPGHDVINQTALQNLGVDAATIALVNQVSHRIDQAPYNNRGRYHAGQNYVQTLRFLYEVARGYLHDAGFNHTTFRPSYTQNNAGSIADFNQISADITALFTQFNAPANNPTRRAWVVVGVIAHLVGDIHAHRTIVPTQALTDGLINDPASANNTGFHSTRFRASEFPNVSFFNRLFRIIFGGDFTHTCGGVFSPLVRDDISLLNAMQHAPTQGINRRGCWACVSRSIELGVLEFRDIQHVIANHNSSARFPDGVSRPIWQFYEDHHAPYGFFARRVEQSRIALQNVVRGMQNNTSFSSYWLMPSGSNDLILDFFWPYARTVYINAQAQSPNEGWLRNVNYHRFSTFRCGIRASCNFPSTDEHYLHAPSGCQRETLPPPL